MRIVLLLLNLFPLLLACDCEDEAKERDKERREDAYYHGCRSCRHSPLIHSEACPEYGFDCNEEWKITVNVLTPTDACRCAEARCEGSAQMAFEKRIVNKLRCNNSIWIVGEKEAYAVVCAKSCNAGICKASNPRASADFKPLKVTAADKNNRCATGTCDFGLVSIDDDGSLIASLDGVTEVSCSSDGVWLNGDEKHKYVMCNASPCGPTRCPSLVPGPALDEGLAFPLIITGNGAQCATATCKNGFLLMTKEGEVNGALDGTKITCQEDGTWMDSKQVPHEHVMCAPSGELPCPSPPNWDGHPLSDGKTLYSDLPRPTYENGARIYKCDFKMIGSDRKTVDDGLSLVCKPDTGRYILRTADGKVKEIPNGMSYACSEKACLSVSMFEDSQAQVPLEFTAGGDIMTETQGDRKVAMCPPGSALYDFLNPPTPELVAQGNIPSCKRNSGLWMPDKGPKYRCLKKKCDPATVATTDAQYCPVTKCDQTKAAKTESDVKCASPLEVSFQDSASGTPKRVKTLTCDSTTGKWKFDSGESVDKVFVTCAPESGCTSCLAPPLIGITDPVCVDPLDRYCTNAAAIASDDATLCSKISCPPDGSDVSVIGSNNMIAKLASAPVCKDGKWRVGAQEQNLENGVVCTKAIDCSACRAKMEMGYRKQANNAAPFDTTVKEQRTRTCTYTCASGFNLNNDNDPTDKEKHDSITCDSITLATMFKGGDLGDEPFEANADWSCYACDCKIGNPTCPPDTDCVKPTQDSCKFTCGPGYTAIYTDIDGKVQTAPGGDYSCRGKSFPSLPNYGKELLCVKSKPCKYSCDATLIPTTPWGALPANLMAPNRKDCSFSCPANMGLFRFDAGLNAAISIAGATCESTGKYRVTSTLSVDRIGCSACGLQDGPYGDGKARMQNCVLSCPDGFNIVYSTFAAPGDTKIADHLYTIIILGAPRWYDLVNGQVELDQYVCQAI